LNYELGLFFSIFVKKQNNIKIKTCLAAKKPLSDVFFRIEMQINGFCQTITTIFKRLLNLKEC